MYFFKICLQLAQLPSEKWVMIRSCPCLGHSGVFLFSVRVDMCRGTSCSRFLLFRCSLRLLLIRVLWRPFVILRVSKEENVALSSLLLSSWSHDQSCDQRGCYFCRTKSHYIYSTSGFSGFVYSASFLVHMSYFSTVEHDFSGLAKMLQCSHL